MNPLNRLSRRSLIQSSLGAAALVATPALHAATPTPHQTEGPFFPTKDQADKDLDLTLIEGHTERALGEVVEIEVRVLDVEDKPIEGALVDVWQANMHGRYAHERDPNPAPLDPHFQGWAQRTTDASGGFRLRTIRPGAYKVGDDWSRPPHIHYKVARRGYHELTTQMYFAGDPLNDVDRILQAVPEAERAGLVVSFAAGAEGSTPSGQFDIVLRKA